MLPEGLHNDCCSPHDQADRHASCTGSQPCGMHLLRRILQLRGPYAFVLWHARSRRLYFARDPLGRRSLLARACAGQFALCSCAAGAPTAVLPVAPVSSKLQPDGEKSLQAEPPSDRYVEVPPGLHVISWTELSRKHGCILSGETRSSDQDAAGMGAGCSSERSHWQVHCLSNSAAYCTWQRQLQQHRAQLPPSQACSCQTAAVSDDATWHNPAHSQTIAAGATSNGVCDSESTCTMSKPCHTPLAISCKHSAVCGRSASQQTAGGQDERMQRQQDAEELVMERLAEAVHIRCTTMDRAEAQQTAWCAWHCTDTSV
jgi:hypothetical protein